MIISVDTGQAFAKNQQLICDKVGIDENYLVHIYHVQE